MEKRNFTNKNIVKLRKNDGTLINEQNDILNEVKNFYEVLYKNKDDTLEEVDLDELLKDYQISKIKDSDKRELESPITMEEIARSVKNLKNNKSPGPDGFSAEFFKFFWPYLKHFFI